MATYKPATTGYYAYIKRLREQYPDASLPMLQQLASLGGYAKEEGVSLDMYETPDQMLEDLQARRQNEAQQRQQQAPPRQAPVQMPRQYAQQSGSGAAMFNPSQQFSIHRGMVSDVMGAVGNELDSRVAQEREGRRMQHESEMTMQQMQMQYEMLLAKLRHEREMAEREMMMKREQADRQRGVISNSAWLQPETQSYAERLRASGYGRR